MTLSMLRIHTSESVSADVDARVSHMTGQVKDTLMTMQPRTTILVTIKHIR